MKFVFWRSDQVSKPIICTMQVQNRVFAFHHTNPLWENHVILLPKKHIE